jgi:hypothetical protein
MHRRDDVWHLQGASLSDAASALFSQTRALTRNVDLLGVRNGTLCSTLASSTRKSSTAGMVIHVHHGDPSGRSGFMDSLFEARASRLMHRPRTVGASAVRGS